MDANFVRDYRKTAKLANKLLGPWKVLEKVGELAYRVELPPTIKRHPVFHITQLEPFNESVVPSQTIEPGPVPGGEEEDEYEIERIMDSRNRKGVFEYKVLWKGYEGIEAVQWIKEGDINAEESIEEYHLLNPKRPRPLSRPPAIETRIVFEPSLKKTRD